MARPNDRCGMELDCPADELELGARLPVAVYNGLLRQGYYLAACLLWWALSRELLQVVLWVML